MFKSLSPRARQKRLQKIVIGILVAVLSIGLIGSSIVWTGFGDSPQAQFPDTVEGRIQLYEEQLKDKPNDVNLLMSLAAFYTQAGRTSDAVRSYEQVVRIEPTNVFAHQNLALLYYTQGNLDASEEQLQKALKQEPANPEVNFQYGKLLAERKKFSQAVVAMEKVIEVEKEGPRAEEARRSIEEWKAAAGS